MSLFAQIFEDLTELRHKEYKQTKNDQRSDNRQEDGIGQRRDRAANEKEFVDKEDFLRNVTDILQEIHDNLLNAATTFRDANIAECSDLEAFHNHWKQDNPGWLLTPWAGSSAEEDALSKEHKITVRCMPLDKQDEPEAPCLVTGKPTKLRALWGRSY